jgi:hypothetical protein
MSAGSARTDVSTPAGCATVRAVLRQTVGTRLVGKKYDADGNPVDSPNKCARGAAFLE